MVSNALEKSAKTAKVTSLLVIACSMSSRSSKVLSATFLLVCFVSLKESSCEAGKYVSYFTSKALFVLEKIKF